jgi:hypothetical protein
MAGRPLQPGLAPGDCGWGDPSTSLTCPSWLAPAGQGACATGAPSRHGAGTAGSLDGATTATRSHPYAFDTNDTFSATLAVTATDRAGNTTTQPFHVIEDTGTPTVTIQVPPVAPLRFWVSWLGQDGESGLRDYDVQYKVGISGTWTSWLTHTTQTQAPFVGETGESYFFQVKATDNVNNASAWVEAGPVTVSAVTKYYDHGTQRAVRPASAARRDRHAPGGCGIPWTAWRQPGQATCTATIWGQLPYRLVAMSSFGKEFGKEPERAS